MPLVSHCGVLIHGQKIESGGGIGAVLRKLKVNCVTGNIEQGLTVVVTVIVVWEGILLRISGFEKHTCICTTPPWSPKNWRCS